MTVSVTDQNFQTEVLESAEPVIVDFWAEWCGPCKMMSPIVDEASESLKGKVKVVKINIDENPNVPTQYGIRGIPTFIVFKNGEAVETKVGGMSKTQFSDWVSKLTA
ncbi:MAG: thioredoxin [Alphaproteobacteria bacterium RIFCSPHIGHO2_12_FULL_45_9]|nr:MAG: thioredoxin [Alphaproteobacteria bacterium RIFCSPHIGHO2_02_FULL_46_13]OFW98683.1 MAG: thioredoxin [Alphaproteobacteria bacterium RIFCSPHIGHO2_12_FULL_45_9]